MRTMTLDSKDWQLIEAALELAAAQYAVDANLTRAAGLAPIAAQFVEQAKRARALQSKIETQE